MRVTTLQLLTPAVHRQMVIALSLDVSSLKKKKLHLLCSVTIFANSMVFIFYKCPDIICYNLVWPCMIKGLLKMPLV